jgi:hypothetical protein
MGPFHLMGLACAGEQPGLELLQRWQGAGLPGASLLAQLNDFASRGNPAGGLAGGEAWAGGGGKAGSRARHHGSGHGTSPGRGEGPEPGPQAPLPPPPSSSGQQQLQHGGFQRMVQHMTAPGSLLRTALQTLQQQRPELACQLDDRNLRYLCGMHQEPALLAVHQLLLSEPKACRPGAPFPPFATDTFHKINELFAVAPEHKFARDPQLWQRLAAGEVGSPVPLCLVAWRGPARVKDWLQVGTGLLPGPRGPRLARPAVRMLYVPGG